MLGRMVGIRKGLFEEVVFETLDLSEEASKLFVDTSK